MSRPNDTVDCWFVSADDFAGAMRGIRFNPMYLVYTYFRLRNRFDEDTILGNIGRTDRPEHFHDRIDSTYDYFTGYQANQKVYLTLDKTVFYEVKEIYPAKPLVFTMKKVSGYTTKTPSIEYPLISSTVHRLPFKELSGEVFERLVFAFLQQTGQWKDIQWLGETGKDKGRDIWAIGNDGSHCYQCANYQRLTFRKVSDDINKLIQNKEIPDHLVIVCGGSVSNELRNKIREHAVASGIKSVMVWSGTELEERLRKNAPDVVRRFFNGEPFPEITPGKVIEDAGISIEIVPIIEITLEPVLHIRNSDEELSILLEEAFYNIEQGIEPAVQIIIVEESLLRGKAAVLSKATGSNRKQLLDLRKILDLLGKLKKEIVAKIQLMSLADLYPLRKEFQALSRSFRELLKLSYDGKILYEETELQNFVGASGVPEQALKFQGKWKIDVYRDFDTSTGFSIWLTDSEFNVLKEQLPASMSPKDMWFYGFECSDLTVTVLADKAIPAFIDKIYDLKEEGKIDVNEKNSWSYLPSYKLGMG